MRRIAFVLIGLGLAAGVGQGICSASPQDFAAAPTAADAFTLPRWRFMVAPISYSDDPFASIARRVGRRVDFGLGVSGTVVGQHSDGNDDYWRDIGGDDETVSLSDSRGDTETLSLLLHAELRKWTPRTPALATFCGLRASGGYSWREDDGSTDGVRTDNSGRRDERGEGGSQDRSISAGLGAVAGVDLQLLKHLSLNVTLARASVGTTWRHTGQDSRDWSDEDNRVRAGREDRDDWDRQVKFNFDLTPQLYLTLGF
jgi:hypothetical protein